MINQKNILNKVAMIESQCQAKKSPLISNNFYRSPLRDRQNKLNLSNTPLRTAGKVSLSPLRSRRTDVSTMSVKSTFSKKKNTHQYQQQCRNHSQKIAKYRVQSQDQKIFYCQKCAILLASQGFQVIRLNQMSFSQINPRKTQIQSFLNNLQSLVKSYRLKYSQINYSLNEGQSQLQQEVRKVQDYYFQFLELIEQHKKKVVQQIKEQFQGNNAKIMNIRSELTKVIIQSQSMKKDINQCLQDIILNAEQQKFRPVMNSYNEQVATFRNKLDKLNQTQIQSVKFRKLHFKDIEEACSFFEEGLKIQWEDNQSSSSQSNNQQMQKYSKQSQFQNPVECLQNQQKFVKSSLKDLGGLFCSFDQ